MLERHVPDGRVLDPLRQYARTTAYYGGLYEDVERWKWLGCPVSPLMGALPEPGFDFLSYLLTPAGLEVARRV